MTDPITREEREKEPWYDLEGALDDLTRQNADAVCLRTIRRACNNLVAYESALAAAEARVKDQRERIDRLEEHCFCLGETLTEIAEQPLAEMMGAKEFAEADFIGAYDCCIRRARKAMEG